jgi:riboflavin biosynthesis pyrimidine reductase
MSEPSGVRIERLLEVEGPASVPLPEELERLYAGPLALDERVVFANFVTSIDGVAAIHGIPRSSATISGNAAADRFIVGLLRAVADAVVVGSGTLREHEGPWTAERAFPDAADAFTEARRALGLPDAPALVVVSRSGELPSDHPALANALVVTTASGARFLGESGVRSRDVIAIGDGGALDPRSVIASLRERGFERILTEGGPRVMGSMLAASVIDELFLTVSPKVFGGGPNRQPFTDGVEISELATAPEIVSVRRAGDHLLLRYRLRQRSRSAA